MIFKIKRYNMGDREYKCIHITNVYTYTYTYTRMHRRTRGKKKVEVKCFRKHNDEDNRLGPGA